MGFLLDLLRVSEDLQSQVGMLHARQAVLDLALKAQNEIQRDQMLTEVEKGLHLDIRILQQDMKKFLLQKVRPSLSVGAEAQAIGKPTVRPVNEVELATLLGNRSAPELAGLVRRWLPYPLITDPICRAVIHVLAEEEEDLMAALDDEGEECKAFAARIVTAPQKLIGSEKDMSATQAAQDLIMSIWLGYLEAQRNELGLRLHQIHGPERQPVLQEFVQLLLDQGKIKHGWEKACPILEIHLQRFADA
jgi:hypothetical protein